MALRIYIFEDKTRITVKGYLSPQKIYQAENEHGRLVCVTDGHIKIPCSDMKEFATS